MRFSKYHGIGNDFVLVADPDDHLQLTPHLVRGLCDRRFGVGGDGVIRVGPGTGGGEFFMDYVNSDGSIGEMCGNGIRCLALFVRARGLTDSTELKVETRAGLKVVRVLDGERVEVDMGAPTFTPADIPVRWDGDDGLHVRLAVDGRALEATCLSMGNPHAVLFVDDPDSAPVASLGPRLERHELFPNRTNVEFATVVSPRRVVMRAWERGAGETLACGTGACAAAVAARLVAGAGDRVTVSLPGGELEISWAGSREDPASVLMIGPAARAFDGELDLEDYR